MTRQGAHIIVVGNEKGGSGKSTVAMHLIVSLLRGGLRIGSLDLDARQATLSRYVENRAAYAESRSIALPLPEHHALFPSENPDKDEERLRAILLPLRERCDTIVIDTPGADTPLSRIGHSYADTLITPLNDSLIDLDVLARIDPDTMSVRSFSHYAAMIFEIKKQRAARDGGAIAWVVLRNRLAHIATRNKIEIEKILAELSERLRFVVIPGFGERVVFRELFPSGLTLLDLNKDGIDVGLNMSHVTARQELRQLLEAIKTAHAPRRKK